ncbi:MAG: aldo/keto reductase [Bacteroidota bacterium]
MSNATLQIDTRRPLVNQYSMPLFGLGVYLSKEGDECYHAVQAALAQGYRLIDTASFYENEESVGRAVRESGIPREEIFVTTKVWNDDHGYDATLRAFDKSMKELALDYVDLYLVHYPVSGKRLDTWKAMERIAEGGRCKAIGVSNYFVKHLEELYQHCHIPPTVNQIELSPYCFESRIDTVSFCRDKGIIVQAYSPLVRTQVFNDPPLVALAQKYDKTAAQILIRWALQENISVIPKSSNPKRIRANADVFDFHLSDEDMRHLKSLDKNLFVCWDPAEAE